MIHPQAQFHHLEPGLWRNLGPIMDCFYPPRSTLWVLAQNGKAIRATLDGQPVPPPEGLEKQALFTQYPTSDCVILTDRKALLAYYREANARIEEPVPAATYYSFCAQRWREEPCFRYHLRQPGPPPAPWIDLYGLLGRLLSPYPKDCLLLVEIMEEGRVWFQVALTLREGLITRCTTFEAFRNVLMEEWNQPLNRDSLNQIEMSIGQAPAHVRLEKQDALHRLTQLACQEIE